MAAKKKELAREIHILEEEIKVLEIKRSRSQAALLEAIISRQEPDDTELQFFRSFTAEIEVKRERMLDLMDQLKKLV